MRGLTEGSTAAPLLPLEIIVAKLSPTDPTWSRIPQLKMPQPPAFCCPAAQRFAGWCDDLLNGLTPEGRTPSVEACNVAKVVLLDRFLAELEATPVAHQEHLGGSPPCTVDVFLGATRRLRDITLRAQPPALTPPPKPRRKPKPQPQPEPEPAGIWFATVEETEEQSTSA